MYMQAYNWDGGVAFKQDMHFCESFERSLNWYTFSFVNRKSSGVTILLIIALTLIRALVTYAIIEIVVFKAVYLIHSDLAVICTFIHTPRQHTKLQSGYPQQQYQFSTNVCYTRRHRIWQSTTKVASSLAAST